MVIDTITRGNAWLEADVAGLGRLTDARAELLATALRQAELRAFDVALTFEAGKVDLLELRALNRAFKFEY